MAGSEQKPMTNSENKICQNCKQSFTIETEDFSFYEKIKVPPPTFCPECRAQRRMSFWNEHNLYRKQELLEGKEIFSTYPEHSPIKIYEHTYWWSDAWDAMKYGREYDFSRPFFEQLRDLMRAVPRSSREIKTLTDSDYCDNSNNLKNCYLCFDASYCNDSMYGVQFSYSNKSLDVFFASRLELCYEILSANRCFQTFFTIESNDCRNVWFSRNCYDCDHCFGCVNLRHKQYHIFNVPYSKEEYEKKLKEFNLGSYASLQTLKSKTRNFWKQFPYKYTHGIQNVNVVGDYVYHSKNVYYSYEIDDSINVRYSQRQVKNASEIYDSTNWGDGSQLMYETVVCGENCHGLKFCMFCWPANRDLEYCISCHSSANLFGCVGLQKKEFCILNRQYSQEEYMRLRDKIISHMNTVPYTDKRGIKYTYGEFPPSEISPFGYNETVATDYFPLTKDEVIKRGFAWRDPERREYQITLAADQLPDHINEATTALTKEIIGCLRCKRAYRIIALELEFYQRFGIPVPRACHNCRYEERLSLRNPLRWYKRSCQCAGDQSDNREYKNVSLHSGHSHAEHCLGEFETSYSPERPEIIYCEQCYNAEVA